MSAPGPAHSTPLAWLEAERARIDGWLADHVRGLSATASPHSRLIEAVGYSLQAGGKRVRPILVVECARICGGTDEHARPAALAIECVHTFSLVHDDLPAMDDDDLRRGVPTNHKVFGEALAVLAGDWLLAHALAQASEASTPHVATRLTSVLAEGVKAMIVGQAADIAGERRAPDGDLVDFIHLHKTARLIETACRLGAVSAGACDAETNDLGEYGRRLGIAFQIADDLLDLTGSAAAAGKRVRKDADKSKQTYPAVHGVEASRRRAALEVESALACIERFGSRGVRLRELAHYAAARDH
ncbi:MAG: polyprenyl synthetase family protein [Phycisphaerae bacterium]